MNKRMLPLAVLAMLVLAAFVFPPEPLEIGSQAPMTDVKMSKHRGHAVHRLLHQARRLSFLFRGSYNST